MKAFLSTVGIVAAAAISLGILIGGATVSVPKKVTQISRSVPTETIYIRNEAPNYISDKTIRNDIPAWTTAINKDFAPIWRTPHVRFVTTDRAPAGAIVAYFKHQGKISGALAYHDVQRGVPGIIVYAGTGRFYNFDNSVSFTHEVEELMADPSITITNQGYDYPYVCLTGMGCIAQAQGTVWANEVADPVERYAYFRRGADGSRVKISDFVTPNWFNNHVNGPFDFMHEVQSPYVVAKGGYAQFWDGFTWSAVFNFGGAGRDANGFYLAEGRRG